ncbi:hypothetical protein BC629DRAFT_1503787 [Irpex lacteus]|nr:hypothetical protein BC629DRAFT_1503787 [Irpex lacteus]
MDAPPPLTLWVASASSTEKLFSVQIDGSATVDELAAEISRRDPSFNPTGLALFKCRNIRLEPRASLFPRIHERIDIFGSHSHSSDTDSIHSDSTLNSDTDVSELSFERLKEYKSVRHYFSSSKRSGRVDVFIDVEHVLPDVYEESEHSKGSLVSLVKGMFGSSKVPRRSHSNPKLSHEKHTRS